MNITKFRVPISAGSCFTQAFKTYSNLVCYKTWVTHPKKIKTNSLTYIRTHGDMNKSALKILCKYTTRKTCTSPKVYTEYI